MVYRDVTSERPCRQPGWEARLAQAISGAVGRAYHPQTWNCAKFAHACAVAVRNGPVDYRWRGSLAESADAVLPRVDVTFAQRGDVVLASVPEPSLGVCVGANAAFLTRRGRILEIPMTNPRISCAWAV